MMIHIQTLEEFNQYLNNNKDKLLVVYLTAKWSGPCRTMAPELKALSEDENVVFLRVDIDDVLDLAARYPIRTIPTFLLFKNKEVQATVAGASPTELRENIEEHRT